MNLLDTPWLPVRLQDGTRTLIRPAEIAAKDNPPVALDSPRADFNGALAQFLIGLLQTCLAPKNDDEWEERLERPPTEEQLDAAFSRYHFAFEVDGDGPRFMQDYDKLESLNGKRKPATNEIASLLIEAPGDNTLRNNADHFIKRGHVEALCPVCAVTALFTLQLNAPSGGVGHRTSLRGGGPLTTLVAVDPEGSGLPDTLWHTLWLNVLPETVRLTGNRKLTGPEYIFPWLAPTRTSEKSQTVTPEDAHPYQMYWAMPRRIRLDFDHTRDGVCDLCQRKDRLLTHYVTLNYGINYAGAWRHPLTPYQERDNAEPLPLHPQPGGITYRHWLGLIYEEPEGRRRVTPAIVVREIQSEIRSGRLIVWAFGYDMDNMKPRCWYEAVLPLYQVPDDIRETFARRVGQLIEAAEVCANLVRKQVKEAWFKRPGDVRGDTGFLTDAFYQHTEADFYALLPALLTAMEHGDDGRLLLAQWHRTLTAAALALFDEHTASEELAFADPARVALARDKLVKQLHGAKLKKLLLITQPKEKAA